MYQVYKLNDQLHIVGHGIDVYVSMIGKEVEKITGKGSRNKVKVSDIVNRYLAMKEEDNRQLTHSINGFDFNLHVKSGKFEVEYNNDNVDTFYFWVGEDQFMNKCNEWHRIHSDKVLEKSRAVV